MTPDHTLPADSHPALSASRRRWWVLAVLLAAGLGAGVYALRRTPAAAPKAPGHAAAPAAVVAEPARRGPMVRALDGIGTVTPLATVTVRSRVDGQLMAVHFTEGDVVEAGALLAEIDPRPYQVALAQAEGQMARDQALLANARVDLERYRRLVATDSIPKQQLDTQAALVSQYEGATQTDQAQIDQARLQLTYSRITAPISGRLGLRLVDPGNIVHASDAGGLVTIAQIEPIAVLFTIPEDSVPSVLEKVRGGGPPLVVEAYDRAQQRRLASGRLLTVDNAIDPTTGTLRLKAQFDNADGALFPNQFVNARLLLDRQDDAILIPSAAVQRSAEGAFVYVVQADQTAARRAVRLGLSDDDAVAVEDGVSDGELVVVDGADAVRPGRPVAIRTPLAAAAP
ncbi:MAG: MdtA/MuxA family multidrug efflux RND transporter periplasmic adaptor subunit [Deltaproteobacteria bacterium]|nr:MdtA/MuxA family multidrug efflux RND transporter periplasmic adaptor subunit [Deltaproteobacteria bacterium]